MKRCYGCGSCNPAKRDDLVFGFAGLLWRSKGSAEGEEAMTHHHYIKICRHCQGAIAQCRCAAPKTVTHGTCQQCEASLRFPVDRAVSDARATLLALTPKQQSDLTDLMLAVGDDWGTPDLLARARGPSIVSAPNADAGDSTQTCRGIGVCRLST